MVKLLSPHSLPPKTNTNYQTQRPVWNDQSRKYHKCHLFFTSSRGNFLFPTQKKGKLYHSPEPTKAEKTIPSDSQKWPNHKLQANSFSSNLFSCNSTSLCWRFISLVTMDSAVLHISWLLNARVHLPSTKTFDFSLFVNISNFAGSKNGKDEGRIRICSHFGCCWSILGCVLQNHKREKMMKINVQYKWRIITEEIDGKIYADRYTRHTSTL